MLYKARLSLITITIYLFSNSVFADSLWGKLKNRVKNEVENVVTGKVARKAGDKAGEATDSVLNPDFENAEDDVQDQRRDSNSNQTNKTAKANDSNRGTQPSNGFGGFGGILSAMQQEVTIQDRYSFDLSVKAKQTYDGNTSFMNQWFADGHIMIESDDTTRAIMDLSNEVMIMIDEKAKTKTGMSTQMIQNMAKMAGSYQKANTAEPVDVGKIEKTGKSKKILGYTAQQWVFESKGEKGEVWITDEIKFDFISFSTKLMEMFGGQQSSMMFDFSSLKGNFPVGFPLESVTGIGSGNESYYLVTEISEKPTKMNLSTYQTKSLMSAFNN